jgi:UDP-N-acetylglucosamine 3-dehydrogenase
MKLDDLKVKLFTDGADKAQILDMAKHRGSAGFTTNPSLLKKAGVSDYEAYGRDLVAAVPDRHISFEVFSDDIPEMVAQARVIATWGKNVHVKLPVTNTRGEPLFDTVRTLSHDGVKINMTAIFTAEQVARAVAALSGGAPACVSVFAGRLADLGIDYRPIDAGRGRQRARDAQRRDHLGLHPRSVQRGGGRHAMGCHIITAPADILKKLLSIGVVGAGVMGSNHARVLADLPNVWLAGIADPDPAQGALVASALGCQLVDNIEALIDLGVDAVTIAAPTHLHHALALTAIRKGLPVLVEKPIASSVAEGRAIVAMARQHKVPLMVGHVERFNPAVQSVKETLRGEDILSIGITRVGPFPPRMSNVGVVIDLAVHDIDLIRWFTDSEIADVQPLLARVHAAREDIALLQFRTTSGVLAQITTNWLTPFKARTVHVATRRKYVIADLITRQVTECFGFKPDGSYSMRHPPVGHTEPLRAELLAFVRAIQSGEPPAVSGDEGVASLEVAIRCLNNGNHDHQSAEAMDVAAG